MEDLRRMRRLFRGRDRAKSVEFIREGGKPTKIERDIGEKVDKILRGGYAAFGSIEGVLEAVNLHGAPTFTIWDRISNAPVRSYFPKDRIWADRIKQLLEKRVITRGKVNYFNNGLPRSITSIKDVIDATPDLLSKTKAEFGSLSKDRPSDMIEFMRRIREGV